MKFVYLDYQSTTPVDKQVFEAMTPYFCETFGNASSTHLYGIEAESAVEKSRQVIASLIGAHKNEIFFTSGSTESNNLAIKGVANKKLKGHIITSVTEHKRVLKTCLGLEEQGFQVTYLPINKKGFIELEELKNAIKPDTFLISIMYGNNEIGTLQPIEEIGKIAKDNDILFHCDATQAIAYKPININTLEVDILNFSSHKIYGPKGIGAIYIRDKLVSHSHILPQIDGGGQERNLRGGTLNVPGIIGMGKAVELLIKCMEQDAVRIGNFQKLLFEKIKQGTNCVLNGSLDSRLPNNLNISFPDINGQKFLEKTSNLAISSGSACNSNSQEPSHVLKALGLSKALIQASFRLSLGRYTTEEEVLFASDSIINAFQKCL
jgi:cysteine desulfurase